MRNLGQKTEPRILKKIGARKQPGGGAIPGIPNDGVKGRYLIEVKSTEKKSLGLKREWFEQLEDNALSRSKIPAMVIVFNNRYEPYPPVILDRQEWVAITRADFERLTKGWNAANV